MKYSSDISENDIINSKEMMVYHKILLTTINSESGSLLAFSTDAGCADLHGLSDLGFLSSLGCGLQKEKHKKQVITDKFN